MLKLFIAEEEGRIQSPSVPLRWCVDGDTLTMLREERNLANAQLLIVNVVDGLEISRHLAPLDDMMIYLPFYRAGENLILATIVCGDKLTENFLKKRSKQYYPCVLSCGGDKLIVGREMAELEVIVPLEVFAKKPPDWKWTNLWFETKPKDQCHFRRRRFLAYTIQPICVAIYLLAKLFIALTTIPFLLSCGMRKIDFKPLFHLWNLDSSDIWYYVSFNPINSVFWNSNYEKYRDRKSRYYLIPFTPILCLPVLTYFYFFPPVPNTATVTVTVWDLIFATGKLAILISISFIGLKFLGYLIGKIGCLQLNSLDGLIEWLDKKGQEKRERKRKKAKKEEEERLRIEREEGVKIEEELQVIVCTNKAIDFAPKLDALPLHKRTFSLKFLQTKAKVCKTFQG
jgi:hypothetical protein